MISCRIDGANGNDAASICVTYDVATQHLAVQDIPSHASLDMYFPLSLAMTAIHRLENILEDRISSMSGTYNICTNKLEIHALGVPGMDEELSRGSTQLLCMCADVDFGDKSAIGHYTYNVQVKKYGLARVLSSSASTESSASETTLSRARLQR